MGKGGIIMTIQEMARIYKRICGKYSNDYCNGCPLLPLNFGDGSAEGCLDAMIQSPDEYEKVLLDWAKENPAPTNRDKFFEVFSDRNYETGSCELTCHTIPCRGCDWWNKEYVEPEKREE